MRYHICDWPVQSLVRGRCICARMQWHAVSSKFSTATAKVKRQVQVYFSSEIMLRYLISQWHRGGQSHYRLVMTELVLFLSLLFQLPVAGNITGRILTETKWHHYVTPILSSLHWLPLRFRINLRDLTDHGITWPQIKSQVPQELDCEDLGSSRNSILAGT